MALGAVVTGNPVASDPLDALERRIDDALKHFEAGDGSSWADVEDLLTEGYGRLLALEALCTRLERQHAERVATADGDGDSAEAGRELEAFRGTLVADAARLRQGLSRFKARGMAARQQFAHTA